MQVKEGTRFLADDIDGEQGVAVLACGRGARPFAAVGVNHPRVLPMREKALHQHGFPTGSAPAAVLSGLPFTLFQQFQRHETARSPTCAKRHVHHKHDVDHECGVCPHPGQLLSRLHATLIGQETAVLGRRHAVLGLEPGRQTVQYERHVLHKTEAPVHRHVFIEAVNVGRAPLLRIQTGHALRRANCLLDTTCGGSSVVKDNSRQVERRSEAPGNRLASR